MLEVVIYIKILKNIWLLWLEDYLEDEKQKFFYEINNKRVSKSKYLKTLSPLEKSCKKVVSQPYYFL